MATPISRGLGEVTCDWLLGHPHKTIGRRGWIQASVVTSLQGVLDALRGAAWRCQANREDCSLQNLFPSSEAVAASTRLSWLFLSPVSSMKALYRHCEGIVRGGEKEVVSGPESGPALTRSEPAVIKQDTQNRT